MASGLGELSGGLTLSRVLLAMTGLVAVALALSTPAAARDSLGMFDNWGAFRDPAVPRCYAIARAAHSHHDGPAYADIASWPQRSIRNQLHFHLSRAVAPGSRLALAIGGQHIPLVGGGVHAWVTDPRMNAATISALRSALDMRIFAHDTAHRQFVDMWLLAGAASAMDAATIACTNLR